MARKIGNPQVLPEESQEEMTVVIFKLKGQSSTLQKGFDAINTAFASFGVALPAVAPIRRIAVGTVTKDTGGAKLDEVDETSEVDPEADGEIIDASVNQTATKPQKAAPRAKPKFLPDFDLNLSDKPWKEFASERAPKTDNDKYLLASLWITENAGVPEFTVAHVFTCFRAMQWPEQSDFSQPMRMMKSKKSYFTSTESKKWKLTGPGTEAARAIKAA
jgi:hypothetical protein